MKGLDGKNLVTKTKINRRNLMSNSPKTANWLIKQLYLGLVPLILLSSCDDGGTVLTVNSNELLSPAGKSSGEPFLTTSGEEVFMSWLEAKGEAEHQLKFSKLERDGWSEAKVITEGTNFFVNWADFPSIQPGPDGTLWAHWLQGGTQGGYDYGVRVVKSSDGGETWSEPWTPHDDGTATEHGFVSMMSLGETMGLVWLDGRQFAAAEKDDSIEREMTLRFREVGVDGTPGIETLVDGRVCDCCQTDAAMTPQGPVVVYRDRTEEEIRDIYITRLVAGNWTAGEPVYQDNWNIGGCPVNGPSVAMAGNELYVAWFTGAEDQPRVKLATSLDMGETFNSPVVIDDGNPAGRVAVVGLSTGEALVSWLERTGGEGAEVRMRRVGSTGEVSESVSLTTTTSGRATGFPQLVQDPDGSLLVAWTDVSEESQQVRVARVKIEN